VIDLIAVCWRDHVLLKSLHCSKGSMLPWTKGTTELGLNVVDHTPPSEREKAILKRRPINQTTLRTTLRVRGSD
jgi:hypothetical protein